MTKGKSYNRIVFLTTLSVYLGLVLVGGTAPVLAHSALTRNFDIKNEIEFKDDLDNKPDNEETELSSKSNFPALFAKLLNEIKESPEAGKISLPLSENFHYSGEFKHFIEGFGNRSGHAEHNNHFAFLIESAIHQKFQPKAFELADYNKEAESVRIALESNGADLMLKTSFSKLNSEQFAEFLNREFSSSAKTVSDNLLKQVYENTKVTSENNQVFIVTRLPRGSIDSLLAKNE